MQTSNFFQFICVISPGTQNSQLCRLKQPGAQHLGKVSRAVPGVGQVGVNSIQVWADFPTAGCPLVIARWREQLFLAPPPSAEAGRELS